MNCGQAKSAAGPQEKLQARDSVSSDTVDMPVVPEWPAESAIQPPLPTAPGYAMMPPLPKKSHRLTGREILVSPGQILQPRCHLMDWMTI